MHPRLVMAATLAGLLMAGLTWAPPTDAWGRAGYRFGYPPPPVSTVTPFGSPDSPPAVRVPPAPWAPPAGYRFYGPLPDSPGFYPRSRPSFDWERPFYRDRDHR